MERAGVGEIVWIKYYIIKLCNISHLLKAVIIDADTNAYPRYIFEVKPSNV